MTSEVPRRNRSIDAFRLLMAAAVVVLHSIAANVPGRPAIPLPYWTPPIDAFCRSAVPFFFIVSGYYVRVGVGLRETILRSARRIAPVYAFWLLAYILLVRLGLHPAAPLHWTAIYDGGPAYHLWFLPALAVALIIVPLARHRLGIWPTAAFVVILALIGPIAFAYHQQLGIEHYPWRVSLIVRQLAAPAFVFIGMQLKGRVAPHPAIALAMVAASYLVLLCEGLLLSRGAGGYISYDVLLGTFLLGPSLFLLARSLSEYPFPKSVAHLGELSLGIYASHLAFVWGTRQLLPHPTPLTVATAVVIGLGGGILVSLAFERSKVLARFVS